MRETLIPNSRAAPRGAANRSALVLSWLTRRWYRTRTRADGYRQDLISPWLKILDRRWTRQGDDPNACNGRQGGRMLWRSELCRVADPTSDKRRVAPYVHEPV